MQKDKKVREPKIRCAHFELIRRFYAVAREHGLDTVDSGAMREALSRYFAFTVWSRSDLVAEHWICATAGIQAGELTW